jgi:hypothetical protein
MIHISQKTNIWQRKASIAGKEWRSLVSDQGNHDAHQMISHRSPRGYGRQFDHLGKQIQPFRGCARDNEDKQGKNLGGDNSKNGQTAGNQGVRQSKTIGLRRRRAMTRGVDTAPVRTSIQQWCSCPTAQESQLNQQPAFARHQSLPMVKSVLLAALICAAPGCASSAQDAKVSVDMMGIGGLSCAHWQSTQANRLEGTIWIYGFWTGLNYVASASEQTQTQVDTATAVVEVKKACAQLPSQALASAVWTAYLELNKR